MFEQKVLKKMLVMFGWGEFMQQMNVERLEFLRI